MKDIVKISNKTENFSLKELIFAASGHFFAFLCAFSATKAVVLGSLLPFGLAFLAGSSLVFTPAAAIGVFIGYFLPAVGNGGFRYLAALFAILSIKLLLSHYKRLVSHPAFLTLVALLCNLTTSFIALKGMEIGIIEVLIESLLCAAATYFIARVFKILTKNQVSLSADELCAVLIVAALLLMGLNNLEIGGISLGRILGVMLVLCAAKYGGILSGAIAGITVGLTFTLAGITGNIAIAISFGGLMAGVFSALGKYSQSITLIIFAFIGAVTSADILLLSRTVIETALGCALFLCLPRQAGIYLNRFFSARAQIVAHDGVSKSVTMRLNLASDALKDVSETVEQVGEELSKINSPDFTSVISAIENDACAGCKLRVHCWETKKDSTINALLEITKAIKSGEKDPETFVPLEFKGRCIKSSKVALSTLRHYSEYASRIAAECRIDEVRSVVSDQFDGISAMLCDLSRSYKQDEHFDSTAAENASSALRSLDIGTEESCCKVDKFGRLTIELKLKKTPELVINKLQVMKAVSLACERDFDIPTVSQIGGNIFLTINEKAALTVDFGAEQISAFGTQMCGDAYKYFLDGRGHFIIVLSDGMGTGGRAAVDGAMASGLMSRLIRAGFGYDCSLKILNSSMLFKSTDESLATVDIASIDLFTGETELYKAGAAPTIVRRSGRTGKAESNSLAAGILRDIKFDRATIKCKAGDIVVLLSDGATASGTDWIREEISAFQNGSAQSLAERICEGARRRKNDPRADDITALVAIINKSV